ncbi:TPA: DUF3265 domain-containing protein, partial [Vibrio harveyi]|nr:DUF3265 domain-containing protein [Vibrio harveyi]
LVIKVVCRGIGIALLTP